MTKLASLRNRLDGLRRRRRTARWGTGYSALASAVLCALVAAFVVDCLIAQGHLGTGPRAVLLLGVASTAAWAFYKYTVPFLGQHESIVDMALLVERQQLDPDHRDLVAAMQFESPEAEQWGSRQLETAVIDYVAEFGRGLDVQEGFSREQMTRRVSLLAVVAAIVGIGVFTAPQHASVFFNRMLLGSRHYPSKTHIEQIVVNDLVVLHSVFNSDEDGTRPNDTAKSAQGKPVIFTIQCSGELPNEGKVALFVGESSREDSLTLQKLSLEDRRKRLQEALGEIRLAIERGRNVSDGWIRRVSLLSCFDAAEATETLRAAAGDRTNLSVAAGELQQALDDWSDDAIDDAIYVARLERFSESPIDYGVSLGDAWTDLARLRMIPLPLVEVQSKVTPPDYAAVQPDRDARDDDSQEKLMAHSLDVTVLEGSRVDLNITSSKPLKDATLTIEGGVYALEKTDEAGKTWKLADETLSNETMPLAIVRKPLKYAIQVTDEDDLQLEYPKQGFVGLKPDRPPTVVAGIMKLYIKSRFAMPVAKPSLVYTLSDDHGIVRVEIEGEIIRRTEGVSETFQLAPTLAYNPPKPLLRRPEVFPTKQISYSLYLAALKLSDGQPAKLQYGDKLQLRLAATDYRGRFEGNITRSDTLVFHITDEAGLKNATLALDKPLERGLNAVTNLVGEGDSK